ncbi:MAG TPA: translation initiation factor IF-3 [Rickettsiales bacterium]|nr:translation initiation factor IF-3 [Rickettsiales bacterium]
MTTQKPNNDEPRINHEIRTASIRLIDARGNMVGVVSAREGIRAAEDAGLDLVEISPNAEPPVCKIMDYGKYKYEAQKKAADQRKKQKVIVIKEIKLRPTIDKHDLDVKMRAVHKFIEEGDKVKFSLKFRGREIAHQEIGRKLLEQIQADLADTVKIEMSPRMEGRQLVMMIAPK